MIDLVMTKHPCFSSLHMSMSQLLMGVYLDVCNTINNHRIKSFKDMVGRNSMALYFYIAT